jgi:hypothetical protein
VFDTLVTWRVALGTRPVTPKVFESPTSSPTTAVPWSFEWGPSKVAKGSTAVPFA